MVVEEVSQENLRLQNEMAGMGRDIAAFQSLINEVDGRVRGLDGRLQEVARRQESLAREAAAAASASAAPQAGHVVQQGETLSKIAAQYGVTVEALMALNSITDPNLIQVGENLAIPAP